MMKAVERQSPAGYCQTARPAIDIFTSWWLTSFAVALAALYLSYFAILYRAGTWIVDTAGVPIYTDFGLAWSAGLQALHGDAAALSDPAAFTKIQAALFPASHSFYPNWPYPPTVFLLLAPLAALSYRSAFIAWDVLTLAAFVAIVYLIVPRRAAIALAAAAPFTAWNFLAAQNGFLTGSLLGGALLSLERRPTLAGILIGCLTYKPQFGILFPVALVAARQWRAIASATITAALLAGMSAALFGTHSWALFPHELVAQTELNFLSGEDSNWGYLQSGYGLARLLHAGAGLAWLVHSLIATALAIIIWRVWCSAICWRLKAASLSAAALLATPYAFAYDMAALAIPAAFLAADQLQRGLLPGDRVVWIGLFGAPLALLVTLGDNAQSPTFGGTPISVMTTLALLAAILRRATVLPSESVMPAEIPNRSRFFAAPRKV
jgi:arabinofuranan 3-O-arabinosyltransferase